MSSPRTVKVAAVQPALRVGEMDWNMKRCEDLVRAAAKEHNPEVIILPEAFNCPNVYDKRLRHAAAPVDGAPYQLLKNLARELGCTVGGGFLAKRGGDTRNTYVLADPDGTTNLHDKDEPSVWEYNYYTRGKDDGVFTHRLGTVGLACGWETARSRTARRMVGANVNLVLGGCCWPAYPSWVFPRGWFNRDMQYYRLWAADTTRNFARLVGAPTAIAWHVGPVHSGTPAMPGIPWNTIMTGETQIAERDGTLLARMTYEDGEGSIAADVTIAEPAPVDPVPSGFWVRPQCFSIHFVWHYMKTHGRLRYPIDKALHRFPWQEWPDHDIPNHNPGTLDVSDAKLSGAGTNGKHTTSAETKAAAEAEA
jgi:predicted amidohydrolase